MNRFVSLSVLLALIVLLGSMLFQVIAPFLLPLFLAAVLAVVCQPLHVYLLKQTGSRKGLAAGLTTLALVALLVIPTIVGTSICAVQLYSLANQHLSGDWHQGLDLLWNRCVTPALERVNDIYPGGISDEQISEMKEQFGVSMQDLAGQMASRTFQIASSTVGVFVSLSVAAGIFITALYYFLADGPDLILAAEELIPLPMEHQRRLCDRFAKVVRAVVSATFLAAFFQGFATAVALKICGFDYFWIFLAVTSIAALIPLVGAWIVWGPCAVWLLLQGHWTSAALLTLWGIAVVGMLDNVVKIYVLKNDADLHPLLAFISVVGALQVLGLWGIFIGPIVASCLYALIQIFNIELKELQKERQGESLIKSDAGPVTDGVVMTILEPTIPVQEPVKVDPSSAKRQQKRRR